MGHDLDRSTVSVDQRDCWPAPRALHDEPTPHFGRYLGLINGHD